MSSITKTLLWLAFFLSVLIAGSFLTGAVMIAQKSGFGLHPMIYGVVCLLFAFLAGYLMKKVT